MSPSFSGLGVPDSLTRVLARQAIDTPFDVQVAAIPDALAGRDICARAPTGSGKTIAFGIPIIVRTVGSVPKAPTALVLAPTRELAEQIAEELRPLAKAHDLWIMPAYGGTNINRQIDRLKKGVDIMVACPGRLQDLLDRRALTLESVRTVVIDEADRMADMGFLPDVRKILDQTPTDRQTLLFSATLDKDIAELTRNYQSNPVRHEVGPAKPDIKRLQHHFWLVDRSQRVEVASNLIRRQGKTVVFTRTRHGADRAAKQLAREGLEAAVIHGARSQSQRDRALRHFTEGEALVLVATDVAARGIHIDDVECVLHFDPPEDGKAYVHRSGRTARAGASGTVVCFVDKSQRKAVKHLQREIGLELPVVEPDLDGLSGSRPQSENPGSLPSRAKSTKQGQDSNRNGTARKPGSSGAKQSSNRKKTGGKGKSGSGGRGPGKGQKSQGSRAGNGPNRNKSGQRNPKGKSSGSGRGGGRGGASQTPKRGAGRPQSSNKSNRNKGGSGRRR